MKEEAKVVTTLLPKFSISILDREGVAITSAKPSRTLVTAISSLWVTKNTVRKQLRMLVRADARDIETDQKWKMLTALTSR